MSASRKIRSDAAMVPDFDPLFVRRATRGVGISLRGLRKSFGSHDVLKGIDLDIPPGQFVAIVGKSGCGKSTLLRILAGLDRPSEGDYTLGSSGTPLDPRETSRLMFQEPRLLPWATVLSNVQVGLGVARSDPDAVARAERTLSAVGLQTRSEDWPSVLSGGQKQRVALARALVSRPRFLALDEPLGALDALTRIEMQRLIEGIWLEQSFTAVLVTHDVSEALTLADRLILIEEGMVGLDIGVDIPRPRRRGSVALAALEETILAKLVPPDGPSPDYSI